MASGEHQEGVCSRHMKSAPIAGVLVIRSLPRWEGVGGWIKGPVRRSSHQGSLPVACSKTGPTSALS
jgi:hypothetical protein